jgi:hypothetical protein
MKPFNLEEALAGKPVVTRGGIPVTQITKFEVDKDSLLSVAGVLHGNLCVWSKEGLYDIIEGNPSSRDLLMALEKKSIWVNFWKTENNTIFTSSHNREDQADLEIENKLNSIHIKKIEIEL